MTPSWLERENAAKRKWVGAGKQAINNVNKGDIRKWNSQGIQVEPVIEIERKRTQVEEKESSEE